MHRIYLSLGSNIGDKLSHINKAEHLIEVCIGRIIFKSEYYITQPWGNAEQDSFINSAILISSNSTPMETMIKIEEIEKTLGRKRAEQWGPRIIDIDILLYNNWIVKQSNLEIPHPRIQDRNFVMRPLLDIDKKIIHPKLNKTIEELYIHSPDICEVSKAQ